MRYIVENAETYGIDTNWMFMGGNSAGAGTSLNTVFVSEAEWEATIPGIVARWGNLNTSGNNLSNAFDIKAVYNDCGSTGEAAIQAEDMVPIISFHGYLDNIVPIGSSPQGTAGSAVIHASLLANGVCSELTVDSLGLHCPHPRQFRVARVACFFKSILCNACTSNYFTEEVPADCSTTIVGLDDLLVKEPYFQIYPNPASNQFTISGALNLHQIEILNAKGQILQTILPNGNLHTIDISALPAGLYFLRLWDMKYNLVEVQKMLKE
ncbi:MAG: T9SS type A sorting domain-containing protein [Saprospiraceae bacterium]|nr:T9SS type A sorting domain-containing protein [Saprospiraceae bacterium]